MKDGALDLRIPTLSYSESRAEIGHPLLREVNK